MIAMHKVLNEQYSVLEEGTGKQVGAFLSGILAIYSGGPIVGIVQKRNLKIYQRLEDKLNKNDFRRKSPSMMVGQLLGCIPLVAAAMNLSNQKTIDKIRKIILEKMDKDSILHLDKLTKKIKNKEISKEELKELADLESKLYSQFDAEEIERLKSIAKSG